MLRLTTVQWHACLSLSSACPWCISLLCVLVYIVFLCFYVYLTARQVSLFGTIKLNWTELLWACGSLYQCLWYVIKCNSVNDVTEWHDYENTGFVINEDNTTCERVCYVTFIHSLRKRDLWVFVMKRWHSLRKHDLWVFVMKRWHSLRKHDLWVFVMKRWHSLRKHDLWVFVMKTWHFLRQHDLLMCLLWKHGIHHAT